MPQNCCVPECKRKFYVENGVKISLHTFSEERKLFMKWIVAIRRDIGKHFQVTTHTRVCSRHIKPSDYRPSLAGRKRTLKAGFHMIVDDRGSQIADRRSQKVLRSSAIIWKHTSAIACDPAIVIADDRRR